MGDVLQAKDGHITAGYRDVVINEVKEKLLRRITGY